MIKHNLYASMPLRTFVLALLLGFLPFVSTAGKLYKWVDDQGRTHYSDKLPPTDAHRARSQLDEHGITVNQVGAAKTQEQLRQEQEQERLRQEQQRLVNKQRAYDRVLLRTFRSEDDILMTRNGQIQAIDTSIRVTESNIKRIKSVLDQMEQRAAQRELSGKPVSLKMQKNIQNKRTALTEAYQSIISREHDKNRIRQSFARDLQRFRELKKLQQTNNPVIDAQSTFAQALQNVYSCEDNASCEKPWQLAKEYLRVHSTTRIKINGENIIITDEPRKEGDISLSISRFRDQKLGNTVIFMDLQCMDDPNPNTSCKNLPKVKQIAQGFQTALQQ
jgi:hypothetical protein